MEGTTITYLVVRTDTPVVQYAEYPEEYHVACWLCAAGEVVINGQLAPVKCADVWLYRLKHD